MLNVNTSDINTFIESQAVPWGVNLVMAIVIFVLGRIAVKVIVSLCKKIMLKSNLDPMLVNFLKTIIGSVLMLFVLVAALNQLGVDTTSLVALLGAAGLAIGLSLQDSLKNFAAGVMILLFRPFSSGHFVEAGGATGVVESISLFTTTIRTGDNKEIIVPNGNIYGSNIINYSARDKRRIDMIFGIDYGDDLKQAKKILEDIVSSHHLVLDEPKPVVAVSELADSSVNFVVRPWVKTGDYWSVLFEITESVKLEFDKAGISIPFPQMTVNIKKENS